LGRDGAKKIEICKMNKAETGKTISAAEMLEYVIGCKWSIRILMLIQQKVNRPGAITRSITGLTTKVLNDCLAKMVSFGILAKTAYPEVPPRVEYQFTDFGQKFILILDAVAELQNEINASEK
jgi:DNA-binding HxlR family transcriptional regulator